MTVSLAIIRNNESEIHIERRYELRSPEGVLHDVTPRVLSPIVMLPNLDIFTRYDWLLSNRGGERTRMELSLVKHVSRCRFKEQDDCIDRA